MGGWRTRRMGARALLAAVALCGPYAAAPPMAAASSPAAVALRRIATSYGSLSANSGVERTASGTLALVDYPSGGSWAGPSGYGFAASILAYRGGAWRHVATVHVATAEIYVRPFRPKLVHLTGASDFLIYGGDIAPRFTRDAASVTPTFVVSDVGGRWHVVPFEGAGAIPAALAGLLPPTGPDTAVLYTSVHGDVLRSGVNDCNPTCAAGKVSYYSWTYDAAARAFTHAAAPSCSSATTSNPAPNTAISVAPVGITAVTAKPFHQTIAYFTVPESSPAQSAASFSATISWGDGRTSCAQIEASDAGATSIYVQGRIVRLLSFAVIGTHSYARARRAKARVEITPSGGAAVGGVVPVLVEPLNPAASFLSDPARPSADNITLLVPRASAPPQRPIVEYRWAFADEPGVVVIDSRRSHRVYMSLLHRLARHPSNRSLEHRAVKLGVIPPQRGILGVGNLNPSQVRQMALVWLRYFPLHIVPHIYPNRGRVEVALGVFDSRGRERVLGRVISIGAHCYALFGILPITTCGVGRALTNVAHGLQAVLGGPRRAPDYAAYDVSLSDGVLGPIGGFTITVASNDSVFIAGHAGASVGLGLPGTVSESEGYVGVPYGPAPGANVVSSFIDGWTVPVQGSIPLLSASLIYSPKGIVKAGEEYALQQGTLLGVSLQAGCAVGLGPLPTLASLAPSGPGGHPPSLAIARQLLTSTVVGGLLARASQLPGQLATCAEGPPSFIYGG